MSIRKTPAAVSRGKARQWLSFAQQLADRARRLSLARFRRGVAFEAKADGSPVTAVDREVETMMRRAIRAAFPGHGVAGEEYAERHGDAAQLWLLDPIDGTKSYVCGVPMWGTLIALLDGGVPMFGIVDAPAMDERWIGVTGQATRWLRGAGARGSRCRTSACTALASARLCLPAPDAFRPAEADAVRRLASAVAMRRHGGECYAYGLVAAGRLDLVVESGLDDHDHLPLVPVIEGAGGVVTDWAGRPLDRRSSGQVVAAATRALHAQAIRALEAVAAR